MQTAAIDDASKLAMEAARDGFDIVVAAGGDGTVNEVLNGIAAAPDGLRKARLGILPLGTVNVFARELGISTDLDSAWQIIRNARESSIDLPVVEYEAHGIRRSRYFAQLAGAGLDALAIELVHWPLKKRIGPLAYVVAGLNALMRSQGSITVTGDAQSETGELVLIGNGRLYGGPYAIFPRADLRDGLLEVCVFPKADWLTLARCAPGLLVHRGLPPGSTRNLRAAKLTLTSNRTVPFQLDGDPSSCRRGPGTTSRLRCRGRCRRSPGTRAHHAPSRSSPPSAPPSGTLPRSFRESAKRTRRRIAP
jgi:YegS/Rv2252/BmrU family lipid kinase